MAVFNNILAGSSGQTVGGGAYEIERSLRFNSADSAYLNRTPASESNRKKWTWAAWVKLSKSTASTQEALMTAYVDSSNFTSIWLAVDGLYFYSYSTAGNAFLYTNSLLRDYSAWYHFVCVYDSDNATQADRMIIYINGIRQSTSGPGQAFLGVNSFFNSTALHQIGRDAISVYPLNGYLADVHFIDGQALDPTSFGEFDTNGIWQPIAYSGSYGTNGFHLDFADNSTAAALGTDTSGAGNDWTVNNLSVNNSTQVYSSGASYLGSAILYSGSPAGAFGAGTGNWGVTYNTSTSASLTEGGKVTFPSAITSVSSVVVNCRVTSAGSGYIFINDNASGVLVNSTSFVDVDVTSALTGSSTPSTFSSITFGPNSWNYALAINYITVNGTILTDSTFNYANDSLVDTPTSYGTDTGAGGEVRGNYATLNPLDKGSSQSLSDGNLSLTATSTGYKSVRGTIGVSSGKWYWEQTITTLNTADAPVGIGNAAASLDSFVGGSSGSYGISNNNLKWTGGSSSSYTTGYVQGDVIGVAFDADNWTLTFYKNGSTLGTAFSSITAGTYFPMASASATTSVSTLNFGQRPFAYTAPSGFKALCTTNLPEPTIADGSTVMDVVTYTGTGGARSISGLGFGPDFVWIKNRNVARSHRLFDAVRGATIRLYSDTSGAEGTDATSLTQFNADGFNLEGNAGVNNLNDTYVAWTWDAGSSTVTNNDGSIASQVRANPSAGFSIVSYTGDGAASATIGHGLNVAPQMIMVKNRDVADEGAVYHVGVDATSPQNYFLKLFSTSNGTAARSDVGAMWNDTAPTSSVFSVGTEDNVNASTEDYIAYCFAPVEGYSAFGSYTGNGSADGPFVYTGFRPRWILLRNVSRAQFWYIFDTARDTYNVMDSYLWANTSDTEMTYSICDVVSNGFKIRAGVSDINASTETIIYAAFAENPFALNARAR